MPTVSLRPNATHQKQQPPQPDHHQPQSFLPNYKIVNNSNNNDPSISNIPSRVRASSTTTTMHKPIEFKKDTSTYDIECKVNIDYILYELIGYNVLNINECINNNKYIKSNINSFLLYKYQSINNKISHVKEFKPPNDKYNERIYFRNIEYPQYKLDTNLKIQQIINQNIYTNQIPYLTIKIPMNIFKPKISKNVRQIFNIQLSKDNILNTTVQQFFHSIVKQISNNINDFEIKKLFLGLNENRNDNEDYKNDWSKLAIKANGFEEYIFYSINPNDKICNYECVRQALLHQLDKMDKNTCFLTLVYLNDFDQR
eukprot:491784_1